MTEVTSRRFLDLGALAAVEHLRFAPRRRTEGAFAGRHASRRLGGAGEFADFREYTPGEDLRRLDWKVLGRTGRAYVRLFQDETNLVCTLLVDASTSMQFGSAPTKLEYVQFLATAFSQVIARQQDQVGLAVVADKLSHYLPPGNTLGHLANLHGTIEELTTQPTSDLAGGLDDLFRRVHGRGVLLLFSDFLVDDLEALFGTVRIFRNRGWEVIVLHIVHPEEESLPDGTAFQFVGLENEGQVVCSPEEIRSLYRERFERHAATVQALSLAAGCDHRRVSTAVPYMQTLGEFLVERTG